MAHSVLNLGISQYEDKNEYQRRWRQQSSKIYKTDPEKVREAAWRRRYGISRKDYNELLWQQGGVCAICKTEKPGRNHTHFHVDHNHKTGTVRGLLCDLCNRGLGYFKDSSALLEKAAKYLDKVPVLSTSPPERLDPYDE